MRRRDVLKSTAVLTWLSSLRGQVAPQSVVVMVSVTDERGRYISGLKSSDFRLFEDGIRQTISAFAASDDAVKRLSERETAKPRSDQETFESLRYDLMASYKITYHPDPSNRNDGFRKIKIEIAPDVEKKWRVRHRPGYRPDRRVPETEKK
jgi:hypothetical protein